jgi:hypothetical protein
MGRTSRLNSSFAVGVAAAADANGRVISSAATRRAVKREAGWLRSLAAAPDGVAKTGENTRAA